MKQYKKELGKVSVSAEGKWNIENAYERISMVFEEHTEQAFISKCDVPAGIDLYNREYWMPLNVSGYSDSNIIILNKKINDSKIKSYTLEEAIKSIKPVGRKPGCILVFYNSNTERLDIGGCWEIWQFNDTNVYNWENIKSWQSIYYNYNKFVGWYSNEESLKKYNPFPEVGCYAYIGSELNNSVVFRCDSKYVWTRTKETAKDYVKVILDGTITIGENGNWYQNGKDTNIPASVKGDDGKTPFIRNINNILEYSYDEIEWKPISEQIAAWFRWKAGDVDKHHIGNIQISRDNVTWQNLSGDIVSSLHISKHIGINEQLPTNVAEGTIIAKRTSSTNTTSYELFVYAYNESNSLAWISHGIFTSISVGLTQETGNNENVVMSQKAVTENLNVINDNTGISEYPAFDPAVDYTVGDVVVYEGRLRRFVAEHAAGEWNGTDVEEWSERKEREIHNNNMVFTNSVKYNRYIKELYIEGEYNGIAAKDLGLKIDRAGCNSDGTVFLYISASAIGESQVFVIQTTDNINGYKLVSKSGTTLKLHIINSLSDSIYNWSNATEVGENGVIRSEAFNVKFSPSIEAAIFNDSISIKNNETNTRIDKDKIISSSINREVNIIVGSHINSGGYVNSRGEVKPYTTTVAEYSDYIAVKQGDKFRITAEIRYGQPCVWVKFDKDGNIVSYNNTVGLYEDEEIEIEESVSYIRFSSIITKLSIKRIDAEGSILSNLQDKIEAAQEELGVIKEDIYENLYTEAVVEEENWKIQSRVIVEETGYKSKIYQNTSESTQIIRIKGTANPYISKVPIYGLTYEKPALGVLLNGIILSQSAGQSIDLLVSLNSKQYIVVNGYANQLTVYLHTEKIIKSEKEISIVKKGNVLYGKKYAFCGDSFTQAVFSSLTDDEGRTGKDSPEYWDSERGIWKSYAWHIVDRNNMEFYADGISGSTIGVNYNEDGTVDDSRRPFAYQRYLNVPSDCDYITLMFGLNEGNREAGTKDSTDDSTIWGAYNKVLEHLITVNPYAKIGIIIPDAWLSQTQHDTQIAIAEYWGIPYLDLRSGNNIPLMIGGKLGKEISGKAKSLRNAAFQMSSSDSHPNPKAHAYRSTVIENWLRSL